MGSNMNQRGMAKALGLTQRGNVLERFISSQAIAGYVVAELAAKLKNPLVFQWDSGVAEVPPATPPRRSVSDCDMAERPKVWPPQVL